MWRTVARYVAKADGQDAEVEEERMPAAFYRVVVREDGAGKAGFVMATGSGKEMCALALQIARAVSEGMLGMERAQS